MTKVPLKSQQQRLMNQRPEDWRQLFKDFLSDDSDTRKRARDKLSRRLWQEHKIGMVGKKNFSQINFGDSNEFYNDSLQNTFLRFDYITQAFCRTNQITIDKLNNISDKKLSNLLIRHFNKPTTIQLAIYIVNCNV